MDPSSAVGNWTIVSYGHPDVHLMDRIFGNLLPEGSREV